MSFKTKEMNGIWKDTQTHDSVVEVETEGNVVTELWKTLNATSS